MAEKRAPGAGRSPRQPGPADASAPGAQAAETEPAEQGEPARSTRKRRIRSLDPLPTLRGGTSSLASALLTAIGGMEAAPRIRESLAYAFWPRVVGPQMAAASQVESVQNGVMIVRTRSSVWSHEFVFYKARIRQGLNRMIGAEAITEIVFRARGVEKAPAAAASSEPTAEQLAAVTLEPVEEAELGQLLAALGQVTDEDIRRACSTRLIAETRLRHWRLERGWNLCRRCTSLHDGAHDLCPICRLCR